MARWRGYPIIHNCPITSYTCPLLEEKVLKNNNGFEDPKMMNLHSCSQGRTRAFVKGGGTICTRKRGKNFFGVPPLATVCPPLKNPFFEKILIPFLFSPPLPPGLVLFTIKIHQKDYIFGWLITL